MKLVLLPALLMGVSCASHKRTWMEGHPNFKTHKNRTKVQTGGMVGVEVEDRTCVISFSGYKSCVRSGDKVFLQRKR